LRFECGLKQRGIYCVAHHPVKYVEMVCAAAGVGVALAVSVVEPDLGIT
jgi:hypothetical protein